MNIFDKYKTENYFKWIEANTRR